MKNNIFTGDLTWKGVLGVLVALSSAVGLFFGGQAVLHQIRSHPKSAAAVKDQIFDFLREKSACRDFALAITPQDTTSISNELITLKADLADLQEKIAAQQRLLRTNRDEFAAANLELKKAKRAAGLLPPKRADIGGASVPASLPAADSTNSMAAAANTNAVPLTTNALASATNAAPQPVFDVVAASQTNETLKPLAEKELALAAKQTVIAGLAKEMQKLQADLPARQRAFNIKQRELNGLLDGSGVEAKLARDCQQRLQEAPTWEMLYKALGQELWLAERWLANTNPATRLSGLQLADQARAQAMNSAQNDWLACRICEAFVWPNVALGENNGNTALRDQYLVSAGLAFRQANETNNYIKNSELLISKSASPARADYARYQLGYMFELMGNYEASLQQYRGIQSSNSLLYAAKRIPIVENLLQAKAAKKR